MERQKKWSNADALGNALLVTLSSNKFYALQKKSTSMGWWRVSIAIVALALIASLRASYGAAVSEAAIQIEEPSPFMLVAADSTQTEKTASLPMEE